MKPDEMKPRLARENDHAVEVCCPSCCNPAFVIGYMVDGYRCQFCRCLCYVTGRCTTLEPGGAIPDGWWEEADPDGTAAMARLRVVFRASPIVGSGN